MILAMILVDTVFEFLQAVDQIGNRLPLFWMDVRASVYQFSLLLNAFTEGALTTMPGKMFNHEPSHGYRMLN